jgi:hypothetical protein
MGGFVSLDISDILSAKQDSIINDKSIIDKQKMLTRSIAMDKSTN